MKSNRPLRKSGIVVKELGSESVLYDTDQGAIHILNSIARLIWDCCGGEHTVEDIERAVRANFSVTDGYEVSADIRHTIEVLSSKGLLEKTP